MKDYVNEIKVSIKIHDFECDASQISDILGIQSTDIWKKGEPRQPKALVVHDANGWEYEIIKFDIIYVGEMVDELVGIFEDRLENFKQLPKECYIQISIICFFKRGMPSIAFNKRAIDFIHKIGAEIDFDLYGK
ncbi:MAG: DUF4279 domain-containing protein [Campylobacteraceae bacterium]|jgi:hypothetical protein|nr:DUF4279 domain-containing protein [Campylobacteraceae bacterium]